MSMDEPDAHEAAVDRAIARLAEKMGTPVDLLPPAGTSEAWLREYERPAREAYEARLQETR